MSSWNGQNSLKACCESREDDWAKKVKPRLEAAGDLPANDVHYHKQCNINFRIGRNIPIKFRSLDVYDVSSVGRPTDDEKLKAFHAVIGDLYENDDETITFSELKKRMGDIYFNPYSEKSIKRKLKEYEDIITTNIGKEKIVTTKMSASKVLNNFYRKKNQI